MAEGQKGFRVLLLSPPYPHLGGEELFGISGREEWFPLGVFALANAICLEGTADVHIYYQPDYTPSTLEAVIREYAPDIVGITCFTNTRFACFELTELVKRVNKNIKVLLGGVHATFLDQQIMDNYPCVDMIIRGYAEGAFLDVIKATLNKGDWGRIAGLTWRDEDHKVHRNCNRSLENDLVHELTPHFKSLFIDGLPTWKSMDMILFSMPIETARGCVYTCFFCSRIGPENRTVVDRTPAQSLRYVHGLFELFGRREVYFCDTNFTINRKRVFEFCDLLRSQPFKLDWTCGTRVDLVDKEILSEMKRAGCRKIYYGVDSLCKRILPSIGRNFTPEVAVKNLNLTVECGLEVEANVIIGFPSETTESVLETYSYRRQLHPDVRLVVRPLKIMPGGPLYHHALKEGFKEDYWLEDHGPEFPNYTGSMSEKRILEYCHILKNPKNYTGGKKKKIASSMTHDNHDKRNFLFFLNEAHLLSIEDPLIGALATPSSWDAVAGMVDMARQHDAFVRSIHKAHLYVHVPYCGRLCTFCHCARVLLRRRSDIDAYIKNLKRQMMLLAPVYKGMDASLISFGGGTPSILDEQQMTAVLDGVDKAFPARGRKILFEVNPSSWTASKLKVLSSRGLFRLSIGVQSLDEKVLKQVTRSQTKQKVLWCLRSARKAGVPYVNVDLIAGLPGQTVKGLIKDLKILINEGANIVHVHPYCSSSVNELCAPGETVPAFFKRRDAMMKESAQVLTEAGFRRKGLGAYTRNEEGEDHQEEAYSRLEAAVAAFGPSAKGQVPGAVFYRVGASRSTEDPAVDASAQDLGYAMAHYAVNAIISGLDEQAFFQRFGTSLKQSCAEGLGYLQESGLIELSQGVWKFSGKWDIRRVREYVVLSRALFGDRLLSRLRARFANQYDPRQDYSGGKSFLKAYANSWLMTLYYQMGV